MKRITEFKVKTTHEILFNIKKSSIVLTYDRAVGQSVSGLEHKILGQGLLGPIGGVEGAGRVLDCVHCVGAQLGLGHRVQVHPAQHIYETKMSSVKGLNRSEPM